MSVRQLPERFLESTSNSGAGWRAQESALRLALCARRFPFPALAAMSVRQLPERFLESTSNSVPLVGGDRKAFGVWRFPFPAFPALLPPVCVF
jgi:hypothetical protein